jgi:hypothetical protein
MRWLIAAVFACSDTGERPLPAPSRTLAIAVHGGGRVVGPSIDCAGRCTVEVAGSAEIVLRAEPSMGSAFAGWSGACGGVEACTVSADRDLAITASFRDGAHTLEVAVEGVGLGSVVLGTDTSCADACAFERPDGEVVDLAGVALETPGVSFAGWSGACVGSGDCRIVMDRDQAVRARFTRAATGSMVRVRVEGAGAVTSRPVGIDCPGQCSATLPNGPIILDATPAEGSAFGGWTGPCAGMGPSCAITLDGDVEIGATFDPRLVQVAIALLGTGTGSVFEDDGLADCSGPSGGACIASVPAGTMLRFSAVPGPGSRFVEWSGACAGSPNGACDVIADVDHSLGAAFDLDAGNTLTVVIDGPGEVESMPPGITCVGPGTCSAPFDAGTLVTLSATPMQLASFWRWEEDCASFAGRSCTVDMASSRQAKARFGSACDEWSVEIDASQSHAIEAPANPAMDSTGSMTVEVWINELAGSGDGVIAARFNPMAGQCGFGLGRQNDGIRFCVFSGCGVSPPSICVTGPPLGTGWRHVAGVFAGPASLSLYYDGVSVGGPIAGMGAFTGALPIIAAPFTVGRNSGASITPTDLRAQIAFIRLSREPLYNGPFMPMTAPIPLPADALAWTIEEGMGTVIGDASIAGTTGTLTGGVWRNAGPGCP